MNVTDKQKEIAARCATVEDGIRQLKREGLNAGKAIKLIAEQNGKIYNRWREQQPVQPKVTDLAKNPQRFSVRG